MNAIEFDFGRLGEGWVREELKPQDANGNAGLKAIYKHPNPKAAVFYSSKPVSLDENPFQSELILADHIRQIEEEIGDAKVASKLKPYNLELRQVLGDYILTLMKPVAGGRCRFLINIYKRGAIEKLVIDVPRVNERQAFELGKVLTGLQKLEVIQKINPTSFVQRARRFQDSAFQNRSRMAQAYQSSKYFLDWVWVAFLVLVGGVILYALLRNRNRPEEVMPNSYVSIDQIKNQEIERDSLKK